MITLMTKDGSKTGNAIIYGGCDFLPSPFFPDQALGDPEPIFFVETDFGNHLKLTWREIEDMFTIGRVMDHQQWRMEREKLHERKDLAQQVADGDMMTYPG